MSEYGSGIALNRNWDFDIGGTGDLRATIGVEELQKDIAFNIARQVERRLGQRIDPNEIARVRVIVRDALNNDTRINGINSVNVRETSTMDELEIIANVNAAVGESPELVFEISV